MTAPAASPASLHGARLALLIAGVTLVWGTNWPIMKVTIAEIPVLVFRAYCVVGGALGLFAIAALARFRLRPQAGEWPRLALHAAFNVTSWQVLATYGLLALPPGRAAILAFTMPAWTVLFSRFLLGEAFTRERAISVSLGMAGLVLLIAEDWRSVAGAPVGAMLMIVAAICWALGIVFMKKYPVSMPTTSSTAWQIVLGGAPIVVAAFVFSPQGFFMPSAVPAFGVVYNILLAFMFAYWAWFKLVERAPAGVSALSSLAIPVIGVLSTALMLGQWPAPLDWLALALIAGSMLVNLLPVLRVAPAA